MGRGRKVWGGGGHWGPGSECRDSNSCASSVMKTSDLRHISLQKGYLAGCSHYNFGDRNKFH